MDHLHARLKSERVRLGLTQDALGAAGGVKKNAQFKYEQGSRVPDADYLAAVASIGVDVLYVLTGERSAPHRYTKLDAQEARRRLDEAHSVLESGDPAQVSRIQPTLVDLGGAYWLPERVRAEADALLAQIGDETAQARYAERAKRVGAKARAAVEAVGAAFADVAWSPPEVIRQMLVNLAYRHDLDSEELAEIVAALHLAVRPGAAGAR